MYLMQSTFCATAITGDIRNILSSHTSCSLTFCHCLYTR